MRLGPTTQPRLAHLWNSNDELLNPTVLISHMKNKKNNKWKIRILFVIFSPVVDQLVSQMSLT